MTALTFSFFCRTAVGVLDWITVTVLPADLLPSHASAMQGVRQADTYGEISFFEATKELVTGLTTALDILYGRIHGWSSRQDNYWITSTN